MSNLRMNFVNELARLFLLHMIQIRTIDENGVFTKNKNYKKKFPKKMLPFIFKPNIAIRVH